MDVTLETRLQGLEPQLVTLILSIASSIAQISSLLRHVSTAEAGSSNPSGDSQLVADLATDEAVLQALKSSGVVAIGSSEEQPHDIDLGGSAYSVAWDPLDGSSIIGANWAVGSIFSIYPGRGLLNRPGTDQIAAVYAVYGPKTLLIIARPKVGSGTSAAALVVEEYILVSHTSITENTTTSTSTATTKTTTTSTTATTTSSIWSLSRENIKIADSKKIIAPANARCTADNAAYRSLMMHWLEERYTIRYTGGMVPDIHHILVKGGGVFCSPASVQAPAKLRVLYECLPLAFIMEAAGGRCITAGEAGGGGVGQGVRGMLEVAAKTHTDRSSICLGSRNEVDKCRDAMIVN